MTGSRVAVRRAWLLVGWLGIAVVVYLSLMPRPPRLGIGIAHENRIGHVASYALLMLWFSQPVVLLRGRRWTASGLCLLAVVLEFAQLATQYRTFSYADMSAGAIGVMIGWMLSPPRMPNLLAIVERIAARRGASANGVDRDDRSSRRS